MTYEKLLAYLYITNFLFLEYTHMCINTGWGKVGLQLFV